MTPLRFFALALAALGLAPGFAHLLELPAKMRYSAELYTQVTSSLYALFGSVASVVQLAAVAAAAALTYFSRRSPEFVYRLLGTMSLAASILLWAATVAPVNAAWAEALRSTPQIAQAAYAALRNRWEYGHVAAFIAWFVGYCALQWSVCRDNPRQRAATPSSTQTVSRAA
jgi:hypothetical protein